MKKLLTAITVSIMTALALPAVAQSTDCGMGRGLGPCYQQGPGAGYGPGRQDGQFNTEDRINRRVERLTARLNLSPEQQAQVRTILQEQSSQGAASWNETHNRIAAVLNDQQRAQFEQWRAQRGGRGRGMGPGPGYGPGSSYGPGPGAGSQN